MQQKTIIKIVRIFTGVLLLPSALLCFAVIMSYNGDIIDRNAGWILLQLVIIFGGFIGSNLMPDDPANRAYRKKTTEELMSEIRKPNLKKRGGRGSV